MIYMTDTILSQDTYVPLVIGYNLPIKAQGEGGFLWQKRSITKLTSLSVENTESGKA